MHSHSESFQGLGIAPKFLDVLNRNNFVTPTPIQRQSIPVAIEGKDIIGVAQTGTGKTLAFGIPLLQRLMEVQGQALIILPTRELALQVEESLFKIGRPFGLKTAVLIGGEPIWRQIRQLRARPHIFIVTPGRLIDHLEQRTLNLDSIKILVLDEADRMLDMGFAPQINRILQQLPAEKQTMLFSATMPAEIVSIASRHMKLPVRVEVAPTGSMAKDVTHELFFVDKPNKISLLQTVLSEYKGSVLVFTRTKYETTKIAKAISAMGHTAVEMHSNRSLGQRREALQGFKVGKYRVLVATDIVARGIDVSGIELVINFDLPSTAEDYVHRIGRTGRAGSVGHAISFAMPHQRSEVRSIERVVRKALPVSPLPAHIKNISQPSRPFEGAYTPRVPAHAFNRGGGSYRGQRGPRKPFSGRRPQRKPFGGTSF